MSDQDGWDFCWSFSRVRLGLSDEEFFLLTPRQWDLLAIRHRERMEHTELLAGIVAATIANHAGRIREKPVTHADFMPSQWVAKRERKPREKRINRQAIAANIRNLFNAQIAKQQSQQIN
jgi:hypothetical protein